MDNNEQQLEQVENPVANSKVIEEVKAMIEKDKASRGIESKESESATPVGDIDMIKQQVELLSKEEKLDQNQVKELTQQFNALHKDSATADHGIGVNFAFVIVLALILVSLASILRIAGII